MKIKALLMDFDGTLVNRDMLSEVIDLVGKKEESEQIDQDFQSGKIQGLDGLIARINLLTGITVEQIQDKVREDLALIDGAEELVNFCKEQNITIILASGSIVSILEVYHQQLGIDYLVGSEPVIEADVIKGISIDNYPSDGHFKVVGIKKILAKLDFTAAECVAIGDGKGDIPMFELAAKAIAINPMGGVEEYANEVVTNLVEAKIILQQWMNNHD